MEEDLVRMATELTRQANQMHEMQLEIERIATTTSKAEERAKVAEEKACAAVMAIGMVKHGQGPRAKERPFSTAMPRSFGQKRTRQTGRTRRASRSSWERPRRT